MTTPDLPDRLGVFQSIFYGLGNRRRRDLLSDFGNLVGKQLPVLRVNHRLYLGAQDLDLKTKMNDAL